MDRPSLEGAIDVTTGASAESASPADPDWRSRWLTVARRAWPVVTRLALVANLIALPAFARSQLNHTIRAELPAWHLSPAGYVAVMIGPPGRLNAGLPDHRCLARREGIEAWQQDD